MRPGQIVAGKYRVQSFLGRGGMGHVVAAVDLHLGRRLAIKFLRRNGPTEATAAARFLREARTVASLRSEHVCQLLDHGDADGVPFFAMELLVGTTLAEHLRQRGRLRTEEACEWLVQTCDAIGEAHLAGIVHRDLKPSNLFLAEQHGRDAMIKVLDFGVAKALIGSGERTLTDAYTLLGTPLYASPEQLQNSKDVDACTDVWSLGVILYELLAGWPPFLAKDVKRLLTRVCRSEPHPLRAIRPDVPPELETIVNRCLEKQREARFQNAGELGLELTRLLPHAQARFERLVAFARAPSRRSSAPPSRRPTSQAAELGLPRAKASSLDPHTTTSGEVASAPSSRWRWVAGAVTVVVAAGALHLARSGRGPVGPATLDSIQALKPAAISVDATPRVRVTVSVDPPSAKISMDGVPVPGNPFSSLLPSSDRQHRVVASLEGYRTEEWTFRLNRDVFVELALEKSQAARLHTAEPAAIPEPRKKGSGSPGPKGPTAPPSRGRERSLDVANPFVRSP